MANAYWGIMARVFFKYLCLPEIFPTKSVSQQRHFFLDLIKEELFTLFSRWTFHQGKTRPHVESSVIYVDTFVHARILLLPTLGHKRFLAHTLIKLDVPHRLVLLIPFCRKYLYRSCQ